MMQTAINAIVIGYLLLKAFDWFMSGSIRKW